MFSQPPSRVAAPGGPALGQIRYRQGGDGWANALLGTQIAAYGKILNACNSSRRMCALGSLTSTRGAAACTITDWRAGRAAAAGRTEEKAAVACIVDWLLESREE